MSSKSCRKILWILNTLPVRQGVQKLHLFVAKYSFELPPPNLPETPLMMSMGAIFAMIVVFFRLVNGSKMGLHSFGMISEFLRYRFSPKRSVYQQACECKVTTRKRGSQIFCKFVAFRNVKIGSLSQCLRGKINFFVAQKCADFKVSLLAKVTLTANLTIDAPNRPICTLLVTVKK